MELPTATTEGKDGAEAILVDFSDGLKALMAVPVWFLSTWGDPSGCLQHLIELRLRFSSGSLLF